MRVYAYDKCDSCRKALRFLREREIKFDLLPIREQPPSRAELRHVLHHVGALRRLFNTSGVDYRTLGIGAKLPAMTEEEAIELLAGNGNLVKRPFVVDSDWGSAGFDEEAWKSFFDRR